MNKKIKILVVTICWLPLLLAGGVVLCVYITYSNLTNVKNITHQSYMPLKDLSNLLYYDYFRPQWQGSKACTDYDSELVYIPRIGEALYNSPEFSTKITFTDEGVRKQGKNKNPRVNKKILILGDSFAMGWGVNDKETFSSILSDQYGWNTSNASCSSYETIREILYSIKIKALQASDVVLFVYCNNDAPANRSIVASGNLRKIPTNADDWWKGPGSYRQQDVTIKGIIAAFKGLYLSEKSIFKFFSKVMTIKYSYGGIDDVGVSAADSASDLVFILKSFPELKNKEIYICEINGKNALPITMHYLMSLNNVEPISGLINIKLQVSDFFLFDDHLNSAGHKTVAGQINDFLTSRKLHEKAD